MIQWCKKQMAQDIMKVGKSVVSMKKLWIEKCFIPLLKAVDILKYQTPKKLPR